MKNRLVKLIRSIISEEIRSNSKERSILDNFTKDDNQLFDFYYRDNNSDTKILKGKIVYVRFGLPDTDDDGGFTPSKKHTFGEESYSEDGISVFESGYDGNRIAVFSPSSRASSSYDELYNSSRDVYVVDGELSDSDGTDGEPLIEPSTFKIITKVPKDMLIMAS